MRLNEIQYDNAKPIEGYGPGFFRIGGEVVKGPVIVDAKGVAGWGGYSDTAPLLAMVGAVDVVFIGTGADTANIPADLRAALEDAGIGVEAMATPAACRTYNVLLSEGRRVALALIPV